MCKVESEVDETGMKPDDATGMLYRGPCREGG